MRGFARRSLGIIASLCAAGCTVVGGPGLDELGHEAEDDEPGDEADGVALDSILAGRFAPLTGYTGIGGRAQLVRILDGTTRVDVQLTGLPAGLAMMAHVHALPCAYQGGGHYKIDPSVVDTLEENELWLHLMTSVDGIAATSMLFPHFARGDALSIVLHDPASSAKMACADLIDGSADSVTALGGLLRPFAQAEEIDETLGGAVSVLRSPDTTNVYLLVDGLADEQVYASHVHALPCDVLDGGGHYKIDPTVVDTIEENELWLDLSEPDGGALWSVSSFDHGVRADAQSIVLHRVVGDTKPKVACADLERFEASPLSTGGDAVLLQAGLERTPDLWATAGMTRSLDGTTDVWLAASGLVAGATYPVHVHDLPCAIKDGGAHYLIEPATGAGEANEIWLPMRVDGTGDGWANTLATHVARPEAQALVIHDPADNARLACIDLE